MKFTSERKIISVHVLVWACFLSLSWVQFYTDFKEVTAEFYYSKIINIAIFYLNYLYFVPRFLLKRELGKYLLLVLFILVLRGLLGEFFQPDFVRLNRMGEVLQKLGHNNPMPPMEGFKPDMEHGGPPRMWAFRYVMPTIVPFLLIVIGAVIRMYTEWKITEDTKKEIAAKKVSSELQFLKAQLNPHFLFNSLNTIYSLSVKKSAETPEAVINLSEMMRYMLYEADKDFVPLEKELDYLHNYIYLQRLRLANDQEVSLNIHGDYHHKKIQPLLFVSFVENAFKYGTDFTGKTKIKIVIRIEDDGLSFYCENVIGRVDKDKNSSGIGLENTKSRLALLYPNSHELNINNKDGKFTVHLIIKFK
ncbi:sensor histidine kinase [Neptunitalea lumnitzerae]|uniref:Signal transduction histidine kinase internal region domain-containing protein n=1 Tax=Neptunitalea lumnitzerae TaxID=2965509 RepID=A0ABQ5MI14_9FLAO|nr:sensor histidine kinase [Neptunitalea sp. Y10]GLB49034.1 hypothetical protein Y10_14020 [Neptunitalea sp. Y10]